MGREVWMDPVADALQALKERARELGERRGRPEAEISSISARLQAAGQPGLSGNLLDSEGFPRSNVDIPRIRADRHRLSVLHTDHRAVSVELEAAIAALHEAARDPSAQGLSRRTDSSRTPAVLPAAGNPASRQLEPMAVDSQGVAGQAPAPAPSADSLAAAGLPLGASVDVARSAGMTAGQAPGVPFAVIDEVSPGSPGEADGIRVGDCLLCFGGVTAATPDHVPAVAAELRHAEGQPVQVVVLRAGCQLALQVVPRRWQGRGLLGCHMRPIQP